MSNPIPTCYLCTKDWARRASGTREAVCMATPCYDSTMQRLETIPNINDMERREILINWSIVDRNTHERINVCTECHKKLIGLLAYLI